MKKIIIIILSCFLLCSCYDYRELNDMSIVSAIGIDYVDNLYVVSLEITKSTKDGSSNEIKTSNVKGYGTNINEAFNDAKGMADKLIYMEHVEVLVVSEKVAKKGISTLLEYVIRDTTINNNYFMVVTDNIDNIVGKSIKEDSSSELITNTIESYGDNTKWDNLDSIASNLMNKYQDIALPYVILNGDVLEYKKIAFFNNDKMVDLIDNKIYNFVKLDTIGIGFNDNENSIDIYKKNVEYKVNKDKIDINIKAYGTIKEVNSETNLMDEASYKKLEDNFKGIITSEVNNFISDTKKNDSDLLGLQDKYFKKFGYERDNVRYSINLKLIINKNGTIYGGIK